MLLFLGNLRRTIIAAIAIPTSIIGTFALMYAMGFTLNIITLLALALAVGIVIDDAIVVLENIFRFIEEKHVAPFPAAIDATKEIGLAVLATTLSLMAVFLPVAFMGGIVGRFLNRFGLTMAFAIAVSLLVSFTLTPMLSSRWLKTPKHGAAERESATRSSSALVDAFYGTSSAPTWRCCAGRCATAGSSSSSASSPSLTVPLLFKVVPKGFLPDDDEAQFEMNVRAPEGTSLEATALIGERIAREVRRCRASTTPCSPSATTTRRRRTSASST